MSNSIPYALSTSWNYRNSQDAQAITDEIKALGFDWVELNFALTGSQVNDFLALKEAGYINISSTHNYCPLPDGVEPKNASPEYYSLTSPDESERSLAVKFTKKSMNFAKRLQARALVMHLGRVDIEDRTKKLFTIKDKSEFAREKERALSERDRAVGPFMQSAIKSLTELLEHARKIDLPIALENRYYIKEMPSLGEFKKIFEIFKEKHLAYWHDTGHAQVYENLGVLRHEDYLDALSNRLIGVHLHDIILFNDHLAPGAGEFDFKRIKPYLKPDTVKVIEAHRVASAEEVRKSKDYLERILGP
ncbi:sugar phosphate isomerase/epimerase family protein [Candidatus Omnitrophota bacterium]